MRQPPAAQQMIEMSSKPLSDRGFFSWHLLQLIAMIAGSVTVALGLAVMAGWHLHSETLLQLQPTFAPMQYNAALSFVLCGIGLLALTRGRAGIAAACGALATVIGLLTFSEYLFGINVGIDQLLIKASITVQTSHPGRMAPNTAVSFMLAGAALWMMSVSASREHILLMAGPFSSIVLALGLVSAIGYLSGLETYRWGYFTGMAVHTAVGCTILGGGLIAFAWWAGTTAWAIAPQRFAVLVGICGLTATLCLWQALIAHEHALVKRTSELVAASVQNEIIAQLKPRVLSLLRMAKSWERSGKPAREMWEADARLYITYYPDVAGVAWVDPSFHVRWIVPLEKYAAMQDQLWAFEERRRSALELTQGSRQITATRTLELLSGGKGFDIIVPIIQDAHFEGFIVGIFRLQELFDDILGNQALRYNIAVFEGIEEIYGRHDTDRRYEREWLQEASLGVYGVTWRLWIWPTRAMLANELSPMPEFGLVAGLLTSGLLAIAVYLAQTARLRAAEVAAANQALQSEIHEHRRTGASLAARVRQMEAVRAVTLEIGRELDLTSLLNLIIKRAITLVEAARAGAVYLWDEQTQLLTPQAWQGRGNWMQDIHFELGQGIVGTVAQQRTGLIVNDYQASPYKQSSFAELFGATAMIAEPLIYRDLIIGAISLDNQGSTQLFGDEDRQLLALFAAQAAIAILNARLFAEVRDRTTHLAQLSTELQNEIAERRQAVEQLERQHETLFQSEKLAAMGSLLASVAHELNNPLSVVTMQADLLSDEMIDEAGAERVKLISQSAERCVRIVQNFLAFARQTPPQRTEVALNAVVEEAMELLSYTLRVDDVDTQLHLDGHLPPLWADPHQLHQVVVNLVTNAHQALRETAPPRRLTLATRSDPSRTHVFLEVTDTGPGVPMELRGRIFEPFFTTKAPGVGTGLGLPFCQGIIEGHGGNISLENLPGPGAKFTIELPVEARPVRALIPQGPATPLASAGKAILIVDDEAGIMSALAYLLNRDGYLVTTASNGRLALEKLEEHAYDLILCDLRMPELDGPGLYRELEQRAPDLLKRMIFLTGDTLSTETTIFLKRADMPYLSKPFRAADVRRVVQQKLQS
jgi:signal transduction histidine kinase/sensor domain CHASE-containing protein/ActR/RegA family two-component response regulator